MRDESRSRLWCKEDVTVLDLCHERRHKLKACATKTEETT